MTTRGATLLSIAAICAIFWLLTLLCPLYVGAAAMILGSACLGFWLVAKVRQAFTFGERDLVARVSGKTVVANGPDGRFYNATKAAMTAQIAAENEARALRRDLEAK